MPLADASIERGQELFELNVWAVLRVTQAFLPLLMKSTHGMIVNNTSVGSVVSTPLLGLYNASKAAVASMTAALRLELQPFGIKVIEMKTGAVKSRFFHNQKLSSGDTASSGTKLPTNTIYAPARADIEAILDGAAIEPLMIESDVWAKTVVGDLLKTSPPPVVWRGGNATMVRISAFAPQWMLDRLLKGVGGMDVVEKRLKEQKQKNM
jgi:1-acylglycerone phosphate reductase